MSGRIEQAALSEIVWTPERGETIPEVRSLSWNQFLLGDEPYFGRSQTSSDVRVTPDTAILSSAVLACCRILAETISVLPLHVYRRVPDGGKEIARDIPLYKVLSFSPNSWQTKMEFFEQMVMNLCLWGNSYTQILSGRYGSVTELINLHPSRMQVERLENGRLRYSYTNPDQGRLERYTQDSIMHIRWTPEPDGIKGMVPIEVAREAIGLARAMEIHAGKFWANSARPGMVLQTDGSLTAEAAERLRDNWERLHRGAERSNRTAILTNGLKVESVGFSAEQSQFEASRRFAVEEIARCYRIPLHLLQGASGGNLEVLGQEFVTYTLLPWIRRIESAISRSLIYNDDVFYAEFDVKGLLRGDSNSRMSFYSSALNQGLMTLNEVRRAEGMAPIGEIGDKHLVAMNLQPLEEAVKPKQPPGGGDPMAAAMGAMGGGGPPAPAQGGVPSLPDVKTGKPPLEAEMGKVSEKKEQPQAASFAEGDSVAWGDNKTGTVKHVMDRGTLDLKSGEKIEVKEGEPVALIEDESGEEHGVPVSQLKKVTEEKAVEEKRSAGGDCGRTPDGKFGPKNDCAGEDGGSSGKPSGSGSGKKSGQDSKTSKTRATAKNSDVDVPPEKDPPKPSGPRPRSRSVTPEDASRLLEKISQNPDGFTLDPLSSEQPPTGIMCSEFTNDSVRSIKFPASEIESDETSLVFADWLTKNTDLLIGDDTRFIGGWRDGEDFYIDVATRFEPVSPEAALERGRNASQYAVFNLETFKETWIQYKPDDPRKPKDFDEKYAAAIARLPEGEREEAKKHGRTTVRSYNALSPIHREEASDGTGRTSPEVRHSVEGQGNSVGVVQGLSGVREEGRRVEGEDTRGRVVSGEVSGEVGFEAGPSGGIRTGLGKPDEVRRLIEDVEALGLDLPSIEVRDDLGKALAFYDHSDDTLYVSPQIDRRSILSLQRSASDRWVSQPNPILHELGHRVHMRTYPATYESSELVEFTAEQRHLISENVSRFAATNGREFVAETVAGVLAGRNYCEEILDLFWEVTSGTEPVS